MTAPDNVIILPVIAKPQAIGDLDEVTLPGLQLPRRVYGRLLRLARERDLEPGAAAEMLLLDAINERAGAQRK